LFKFFCITVAYVQFLDAIRRKNYTDALNAIHRYSVLKGLPDERPWLNPDLTAVGLQPGEASLHLCIMHYNAGHHALALQSLKECIFLAQEKGDTHLLSTCMYWLACLEMNNNQYEKLYRGARGGEFLRFPDVMRHFAGLIGRFDAASGASLLKTLHDLNYAETICDATATPNTIALIQQYSGRASVWKLYGFEDIAVVYAQASVQIFSACQTNAFPIATDAVALSLGQ
jgi:Anaphase-promoting complex subunit 5